MNTYLIHFTIDSLLRRVRLERVLDGYGRQLRPGLYSASLDEVGFGRLEEATLARIDPEEDLLHIYRIPHISA
jgi:hypothetical protein